MFTVESSTHKKNLAPGMDDLVREINAPSSIITRNESYDPSSVKSGP